MCIIAIKPENKKMFSNQVIKTMFTNNPDGAGFMYYDKRTHKVVIKKGFMTYLSLIKELNKHDLTKTNVILHFRIGTSGRNDKMNCHPYPVYEQNSEYCRTDIAVAHNGVLHNYIPYRNSTINDTQLFILEVLRNLDKNFLKDDDKKFLIEELIGANKLAFLDKDNKITLIGKGFIEDNGYIYSNNSYKEERRVKTTSKFEFGGWFEDYEPVKPLKK